MNNLQHWQCEIDADQIAWVTIDRKGEKTNTLSREVVEELGLVVTELEAQTLSGVIVQSGQSSGFIYGADINEFLDLKTEQDAFDLIHKTQSLLDRWESLSCPTVAVISGMCLGGGLEFALACTYRVADTEGETKMALPEVRLGIQPGWGGTIRLPRITGILAAMPLLLTGKMLDPRRAKRLGFVDIAQPKRHCVRAALSLIAKKPEKKRASFINGLISHGCFRWFFASKMKAMLKKMNVREEHYPAPYAMVSNWKQYGLDQSAFKGEAESIASLMMTPTAAQLIRVFFMQSQLKATASGEAFSGKHVHVIGAGTMGGDIASWCAMQGYQVTLQDQSAERIAPAMGRAQKLYAKKYRDKRKVQLVMDRLQADPLGHGVAKADLIIEAVFEDLKVKQAIFHDIELKAKPGAIFATNTSSIPLADIATILNQPERLIGIHFFNPVSKMQLVEVVYDTMSDKKVVQQAAAFVKSIQRFPLPVKSHPGFLVNRVLMPYLMEAMLLFDEGVKVETIDAAAIAFGMPMGPMRLADTVGLDVCLSVAKNLLPLFGGEVSPVLERLVASGHLGVKSKQGFYRYRGREAVVVERPKKVKSLRSEDISDRLIYRQLNESVSVLREQVIDNSDLLDAGMIYGTGFAPFRGGPIQYARSLGLANVRERFKELEQAYGERFAPDSGWGLLENPTVVAQEEKVTVE